MVGTGRGEGLARQATALRDEFRIYAAGRQRAFEEIEELFAELAKGMDIVAASLEDLTPPEERLVALEETGVMGRAFELQALVGIFRNNLADLRRHLAAMR